MSDYKYDLAELRTHKASLATQKAAVGDASSAMSATGAGPKEMYGILVSQIAHPILDHATNGGEDVLKALSELIDSVNEGMGETITAYEQTEADHIDRTDQITHTLNEI